MKQHQILSTTIIKNWGNFQYLSISRWTLAEFPQEMQRIRPESVFRIDENIDISQYHINNYNDNNAWLALYTRTAHECGLPEFDCVSNLTGNRYLIRVHWNRFYQVNLRNREFSQSRKRISLADLDMFPDGILQLLMFQKKQLQLSIVRPMQKSAEPRRIDEI